MPAYAMDEAERDSDMGDSAMIAGFPKKEPIRSEEFEDHSGESSDESVSRGPGRDNPRQHQPIQQIPNRIHQNLPLNIGHHALKRQALNNHQNLNSSTQSGPGGRQINIRENFESFPASLHPHLSSLVSLAQGAPLSTNNNVLAIAGGSGNFSYTPPAFVAPAQPPPATPQQPVGSASSSSSEGSTAGWSFEEQYKQVRQLYEISDEPQRREFLDELFAFMQGKGTPITRLPVMAKTVLDLYELYNLVIARGGLVAVINKKLWQEIIKGLCLPSSITSAAFTLRTQYMRFLYDYECHKKNFSTKAELDAAIEGNKREGRRHAAAANQYAQEVQAHAALGMPQYSRMPPVPQYPQHLPNVPLTAAGAMPHIPTLPLMAMPHPYENIQKLAKVLQDQRDLLHGVTGSPPNIMDLQQVWWNFCNQHMASSIEPQHEALNLTESPKLSMKREGSPSPIQSYKRRGPVSPSRNPHNPYTYFSDMRIRSPDNSSRAPLRRSQRMSTSPRGSISPRASASPRLTPRTSPRLTPRTSPRASPRNSPRNLTSPRASPRITSPHAASHRMSAVNLPTPPLSDPATKQGHARDNDTESIIQGASFRIITKNDTSLDDSSLSIAVDVNGLKYKGVIQLDLE